MAQATITIEDIPGNFPDKTVKLVKVTGQLDESNVDEQSKIIYGLISQVPQGLFMIFDFEGLEYMNSKSIGYLTDWYTKVTEKQGGVVIAKAKANILDILQVVGLTQLMKCVPTLEEAKLAISK